jgi:membrane protein DedA with SNARE-associated domain
LHRRAERILPPTEELMAKHGGKVVFFGRFITVLRYTAAWVAGIAGMPWRKFLFWNAAGGICWATLVGLVSYYAGGAAADAIQRYGIYAAVVVAGAVLIFFLITHFGKKWLADRL